ncbi:RNA recognition motif domain-containing protein [Bacteroides propionicifaciens]|jgi:RNA recognition motif-containing protein|uniref:RNA recognition motif domain-containing protein n=1 Tax=Bacteroides propionicifaciens TaxID=392838 RepID=UPI0003715129|nr:RNA-binding protein [Bacteroides propionicifaciens]
MNIYIGNLNYQVEEANVQQMLEDFGPVVSVKLILDRDTGRSRGFAFVEMENAEDANRAIKELNGADYEGRALVLREARPRD